MPLGISVVRAKGGPRANRLPLNASLKVLGEGSTANVNLVQATTWPGLNDCSTKAKVYVPGLEGSCLLFKPDDQALASVRCQLSDASCT